MRRIAVPGCVLACGVFDLTPPWASARETILFHHGLGATRGTWAAWLPALAGRYRVISFDMRGHGASGRSDASARVDLDVLTDDLFAVLDAVGVRQAHLVGESIGGTIALNAALRAPERALSLTISNGAHVGATIQSLENWERLLGSGSAAEWSAHMMGQRFYPGAISDAAWAWYEVEQARCCPEMLLRGMRALVGTDLRPRLPSLNIPVLLLHPDASPFIPVALMADLRAALPDARLHVIGHAKHGLPFSHAASCAALLAAFLSERAS